MQDIRLLIHASKTSKEAPASRMVNAVIIPIMQGNEALGLGFRAHQRPANETMLSPMNTGEPATCTHDFRIRKHAKLGFALLLLRNALRKKGKAQC